MIIAVIIAAALASGCTRTRANLVENRTVSVETVDSQRTRVSRVSAYQEDTQLVITGRLRRRGTFAVAGSGLVDVIILGPDGTVIDEGSTRYVPRLIRKGHSSTFTMRFPVVAPKGTVVRVAHHPRLYNHPRKVSRGHDISQKPHQANKL